jgi:hypothetical protein
MEIHRTALDDQHPAGVTPFLARLTVVRGTQFPRLSGLLRRFARGRHRIARRLGRLAKDRLKASARSRFCRRPWSPALNVSFLLRDNFSQGLGESR